LNIINQERTGRERRKEKGQCEGKEEDKQEEKQLIPCGK
jgi:hypothetical protein